MKKSLALLFSLYIGTITCYAQHKTIAQRVDSVLHLMTLEEKVGQMNQYSGREVTGPVSTKKNTLLNDIKNGYVGSMLNVKGAKDTRAIQEVAMQSRMKIPLLFSLDVIHGYKTVFPVPLGESASWDMEAIRQSAHIAAKEAAAAGIHWTFAPMVDVARDARWGRVMEGAGEDTYLGSQIAKARVLGLQGGKLGGTDAVMACAKHCAAYGAAIAGRDYNAVDMSNNQLWEVYLPPFKAALDAGAATFMNSFNTLNGVPATGNSYLQRDILKGQWNFNGFVVSDWGSIGEMVTHGYAKDDSDAGMKAVIAGNDMDMESIIYREHLVNLVKNGKVNIALVDDAVRRILYKKFELGLFDDPYRFCNADREQSVLNDPRNRIIARQVAEKSIVLLKNENATLPLSTNLKKIALIGPLVKSKRDMDGGWTVQADTTQIVSLFEGMKKRANAGTQLLYAKGYDVKSDSKQGFAEAIKTASQADVIVLAVGETWDMTGEATSRADIHLPGTQEELYLELKKTGKPIIVLIMAGRPLIFNQIADTAPAILYTWWLGSEAGNAIANVLYGSYNPAGKLPMSFPVSVGQMPIYYNQNITGRPLKNPKDTKYKSAYIDAPNSPRYAFGHGLSYTNFTYGKLELSKTKIQTNDSITVSFELANTGKYAGEEVVQLYLHDMVSSIVRPVKELKDFKKVMLKAGESRKITFVVNKEKLSFYNQKLNWVAEPGDFELMIGSASDDIMLKSKFELLD